MFPTDYIVEVLGEFKSVQLSEDDKGLTFEKELAHEGSFVDANGSEFEWDAEDIREIYASTKEFLKDGETIHLPLEHTRNPEASRGKVISVRLGFNESNERAIFGIVRFRDEEAAKMAKSTQVSVFVPAVSMSGTSKKVYVRPIEHVALTTRPAINNLEDFKAIAASLTPKLKKKGKSMSFIALSKELGLELSSDASEEDAKMSLVSEFKKMRDMKKDESKKPEGGQERKEDEEDEEAKKKKVAASSPKSLPKSSTSFKLPKAVLNQISESREAKIQSLLDNADGPLCSVKLAKELKEQYCGVDDIAASLDDSGEITDSFDSVIKTLKSNGPIFERKESSGIQLSLDDAKDESKNPLLKAVKELN